MFSRIQNFIFSTFPRRVRLYALWFAYRGRPYHEYYRAVMRIRAAKDPKAAIGGKWESMGVHQCAFLRSQGLQPHHTLLDIGCGSLRGGLHFIKYLESGNYHGIDISPDILAEGKRFLKEAGLEHKAPKLKVNDNLELDDFGEKKFDFLNAQSVLSHMPKEDIEQLFANLSKVMHSGSIFIATFFESDKYGPSAEFQNFHYPLAMIQEVGRAHKLEIQKVEDREYKRKQSILKIQMASRS